MDTNRILKLALEESIYRTIMESKVSDKCADAFGQELFGEFRGKREKDTDLERSYIQLLRYFVGDNKKHPTLKKALLHLKDCMKEYPEVLKPDKNILFRGTKMKLDLLSKYVKADFSLLKTRKSFAGKLYCVFDKSYVYKPRYEIQSWTTKPEYAEAFATGHDDPVIYELFANPKEILFNTTFLNKVSKSEGLEEEYEIIRIGKNIKVKAWVRVPKGAR